MCCCNKNIKLINIDKFALITLRNIFLCSENHKYVVFVKDVKYQICEKILEIR